jgi:hypothetical protein
MVGHPRRIAAALVALAILTAGCGSQPDPDLDLVRDSVVTALDAWKTAQPRDALKSRSPPIEFHDEDGQRGARLIAYELTKTYRDTDGAPRCAVTLNLHSGGKSKTVKVTYQANISSKIVIARDPYS